jgi:hypothetical protein
MTGPSAPLLEAGRAAHLERLPRRWLVLIRAYAVLMAVALAALLLSASCDGPPPGAVPRPAPNAPPVAPADGGRG